MITVRCQRYHARRAQLSYSNIIWYLVVDGDPIASDFSRVLSIAINGDGRIQTPDIKSVQVRSVCGFGSIFLFTGCWYVDRLNKRFFITMEMNIIV
jgi:hypothetical protein